MNPRETRDEKAARFRAECRVRVLVADEVSVSALVRGDSDTYRVSIYPDSDGVPLYECSCPYADFHPIRNDCSHIRAVRGLWQMEEPCNPTNTSSASTNRE